MPTGDEQARAREEQIRRQELSLTSSRVTVALVVGMCVVAGRFFFPWLFAGFRPWPPSGIAFVALLWAAAWFAGGFMLGFLFGIPKTVQRALTPGATANGGAEPRSRVNTNLEEISDWLTKILVGATLTQLVKAPGAVRRVAAYMATSAGAPWHESLFAAIVVYFATVGFFSGYVLTRLFFSGAFGRSDSAVSTADVTAMQNVPLVPPDEASPSPVPENVKKAAQSLSAVPITDQLSAGEAMAVATGASVTGDTDRALRAASLAVEKAPQDPGVYISHARALNEAGAHSNVVLDELEKAHRLISASKDKGSVEELYDALMYLALYQDPPAGFTKAIEWEQEFEKTATPTRSSILTNLASAYGQQYEYAKKSQARPDELNKIAENAKRAINRAIEINPRAINRLRQLADGSSAVDRDLVMLAADSPEIREMLQMSAPPALRPPRSPP